VVEVLEERVEKAIVSSWLLRLFAKKGLGHDKNHPDFFATPPLSVTFVIRFPALRTADVVVLTSTPCGVKVQNT
jgi:hypothetical protein